MSIVKQLILVLALALGVGVLAVRHAPQARAFLLESGLSPTLVALAAQGGEQEAPQERGPRAGRGARSAVVTTVPVTAGVISDTVRAIGSGEAQHSVSVVPLGSGVIAELAISSGDVVKKGDLLARLNSASEEIARDQAQVSLNAAKDSLDRYTELARANIASQVELEGLQTAYDASQLSLRDATVDLRERSIFAPIDGSVGILPVEAGDYITTETEVATLDDRSQIIVDVWIPERFASRVALGQLVTAERLADPGQVFEGTVSGIGSRIETDSRTLQVRATIDNADDLLRPGMAFSVSLSFDGDPYPSVDPLAVQWDEDGAYVWTVSEDQSAERTPVQIIQRNSDAVLVDGALTEGQLVVTEGVLTLREGMSVTADSGLRASDTAAATQQRTDLPGAPAPVEREG
mgnify:CR=1 FL=1